MELPATPISPAHSDIPNSYLTESLPPNKEQAVLPTHIVNNRFLFRTHFDELSKYLAAYLAKVGPKWREFPRAKLVRITDRQFLELSTDVYEEAIRRKDNKEPFLPPRIDFHPKRNRARQRLATMTISRFQDLGGDVHFELARRFPEFKEDLNSSLSPVSNILAGLAMIPPLRSNPRISGDRQSAESRRDWVPKRAQGSRRLANARDTISTASMHSIPEGIGSDTADARNESSRANGNLTSPEMLSITGPDIPGVGQEKNRRHDDDRAALTQAFHKGDLDDIIKIWNKNELRTQYLEDQLIRFRNQSTGVMTLREELADMLLKEHRSTKRIQEAEEELKRFRDRYKLLEQSQRVLCSSVESFMVDLNDLSSQAIESATTTTMTESPGDFLRLGLGNLLKEYRSKYERMKTQVNISKATSQTHEMESEVEEVDQQPGPSNHPGHEQQVATAVENETVLDGFDISPAADRDFLASAHTVTAVAEDALEEDPDPGVDFFHAVHERIEVMPSQLEIASRMSATETALIDVLDARNGQPSDDVSETEGSSGVHSSRTVEQSQDEPSTPPGSTSTSTSDSIDWVVMNREMYLSWLA